MENTITIDKSHVEKRVKDWEKRVHDLYSEIQIWLKNSGYSLKLGRKLSMYEEMMAQFNIKPKEIETADIYKDNKIILTLKPKGLWIIGANGLIDILSQNSTYKLVDFAEQFKHPKWRLFNGTNENGIEFNKKAFLQLLK